MELPRTEGAAPPFDPELGRVLAALGGAVHDPLTPANLAVLKNGRAKAVRFTTLAALCEVLECQPGDLLRWEPADHAVSSS